MPGRLHARGGLPPPPPPITYPHSRKKKSHEGWLKTGSVVAVTPLEPQPSARRKEDFVTQDVREKEDLFGFLTQAAHEPHSKISHKRVQALQLLTNGNGENIIDGGLEHNHATIVTRDV